MATVPGVVRGTHRGLPAELERTVLVDGLSEPLDFAFLPDDLNDPNDPNDDEDGGILIAEKGGAIKLYKEGEGTSTLVTLPVKTDFESGIGGIEVDPDFRREPLRLRGLHQRQQRRHAVALHTFRGPKRDPRI